MSEPIDIPTADAMRTHPWLRVMVSREVWERVGHRLAEGTLTLVSHWADGATVHTAWRDPHSGDTGIISLDATNGFFPSLGGMHSPAIRLERAIRDLTGLIPEGAPDPRPWLDHGRWPGKSKAAASQPYAFLAVEGESLHQIPVGPVHAGIIEPGHFRFTCSGETIVRLETRLGYTHKGVAALMTGAPLAQASKLAGRVSGDSTVAYAIAFAQATEVACACEIPPRAVHLRALMLELERIANHLGDIGAICNDAAFSLMLTNCAILRERVLRLAGQMFGHRLMMDCVRPGGVATDIGPKDIKQIGKLIAHFYRRFPAIKALYEDTASLQDRTVRTGVLRYHLAEQFGAGGFIGRASSRNFDARKALPSPPYDKLKFDIALMFRGDVDARIRVRIAEIEQSLSLVKQLLAGLPGGDIIVPVAAQDGEGAALVEGFRGDIFAWLRTSKDGTVSSCHLRDPSCFQWPLLEAAVENNIVADFPLINKSFNCSYSGHDN
jgi:Ni,Fe-hydrogenase III large subunit